MTAAARLAHLTERLNDALPQTQCTRCGYPDCRAYAGAMAEGGAGINQCPPGGAEGIRRLAALTGQAERPLNPENGVEGPRALAVIDEAWCIGCTLCIKACPVDSIVETHHFEYHGEKRGDLYFTKDMLLAVGDRYEKEIAAARAADAAYR